MNVIPILAEYPTMRVLMQNTLVSIHNVSSILRNLNDQINTFKKDLGKFRKRLTIKRLKMGYELDVRDDHAQTVEESAESNFSSSLDSPTKTNTRNNSIVSLKGSSNSKSSTMTANNTVTTTVPQDRRHSRNKSITSKHQQVKKLDTSTAKKSHHHYGHHRHSSSTTTTIGSLGSMKRSPAKDKKDVWGVGKTGSTLSYILRAALFALNLSSKEGRPSLILITDGVVKSTIQDESVIRQLTAEHVSCSVVQIGQEKGFSPGLNFGFVPDNEILEFLTTATNGEFMFAENCPPILPNSDDNLFSDAPNIYHHRLLLKEINLDKVNMKRKINKESSNTNGGQASETENISPTVVVDMANANARPHHEHRRFPWDPIAQPIVEDIGICKYKEYFLPTESWHFMRARLRQGFLLHSVTLIDETKAGNMKTSSTNGVKYVGQTLDEDVTTNSFHKKESVVIVFVLHWKPSITVEYRIKSLWTSSLRNYLRTLSLNQERLIKIPEEPHVLDDDNMFSCMRASRAQIIIKSTASFTHLLSNWDQFQRRNQMMALQGAKSTVDLTGSPGFIKVGKMKKLLERLFETDSMLKGLIQFNFSDKMNTVESKTHKFTDTNEFATQSNYIQKFSTYWEKLERSELRVFNMCWYDEQSFNLIIGSGMTSYTVNNYRLDGDTMGAEIDEVQIALNHLYAKLEQWSTFMSEDQQVYIKVINIGETLSSSKSNPMDNKKSPSTGRKQVVPQFCELRIVRETEKLLCIKLMFFNIDLRHRYHLTEELQTLLSIKSQQQTLASLQVKHPTANQFLEEEEQGSCLSLMTLTKRPLSSLLMRDGVHFLPNATDLENGKSLGILQGNSDNSKSLWYINPALILTGEFIVRNYLLQYTWHWDTRDITKEDPHAHTNRYLTPILNLAFEHFAVARLEQVYHSLFIFPKTFSEIFNL